MSAVLSPCCTCGRFVSVPCPTLDAPDRSAAHLAIEAAGFVWHAALGHRCAEWPACGTDDATPVSPVPSPQADLFGETA